MIFYVYMQWFMYIYQNERPIIHTRVSRGSMASNEKKNIKRFDDDRYVYKSHSMELEDDMILWAEIIKMGITLPILIK